MALIATKYQKVVRDTAANLAAANRVYPVGWLVIEEDTADSFKLADGKTVYNTLPYGMPSGGSTDLTNYVTKTGADTLTNKTMSGSANTFTNIPQSAVVNLSTALTNKQDALVSGTNIKTINGTSLLGGGDIIISGGASADTQSALTYAATTNFDFAQADAVRTLALTGNVTFTTSNRAAARSKVIILTADATTRTLTFPTGWVWLDQTAPTSLAAGKTAVLNLYVRGTAETDVIASYSAQL